MLHIIGVILKILGLLLKGILFVLAFLAAALLLALLSVLFVPLRYRVEGRRDEKESRISGRVTWLFCFITVSFSYLRGSGVEYSFKILRFVIFGSGKEEKPKAAVKKKKRGKFFRARPVRQEEPRTKEPTKPLEPPKQEFLPEESPKEEAPAKTAEEKKEPEAAAKPLEGKGEASGQARVFSFLREKWESLKRKLFSFFQALKSALEKLANIKEKLLGLKRKAGYYLDILRSEEAKAYLSSAKVWFFKLLRHIRPRKAQGYLHYGFEDPSVTGMLTGVLYLAKPAALQGIALKPDFDVQVLEGTFMIAGHIRLCHVLWIAARLFFNKNRKEIFKRLKEGGKQNGHRQ